ncbi:MAG: tetratricopeptide repeat protein [Lewinellaceae bacterium]|nr:tetratricopeptide repeat protein [Lewinellaceae bacterium]
MLRLYFLLLFFICLGTATLLGQAGTPLDSLVSTCNAYTKEDTVKIKMLLQIANEYQKSNPSKGLVAAGEAVGIAKRLNQPFFIAHSLRIKGVQQSATGAYDDALLTLEEALQLCKTIKNAEKIESDIVNNIGVQYYYKHDLQNAYKYFEQAYIKKTSLGDIGGAGNAIGNMGNVSQQLLDFPKAISCFDQAIAILEKVGNMSARANVLRNKGNTLNLMGDYSNALSLFQQALEYYQKNGLIAREGDLYLSLGVTYNYLNDHEKSIEYYQKALNIYKKTGNKVFYAEACINIGNSYSVMKNYETCLSYLREALPIVMETKDENALAYCYDAFGAVYTELKDFRLALDYFQKSLAIGDKLGNHPTLTSNYLKIGDMHADAPDSVLVEAGISVENRYLLAESFYLKGLKLSKEVGQTLQTSTIWRQMSKFYEKNGDYLKAYNAFKNYVTLNDSILGEDIKNKSPEKKSNSSSTKKKLL